jgi:DNA-binding GntR family transcriptional regulator
MNTSENISTFQERAYTYIKTQITSLGFKPGEYLTDTQIASKLNISRTPVREAFRILEREGLLIYEPRRGWKVYSLSLEDVNEIFEVKIALEQNQSRNAARCKDPTLRKKLKETIERMRRAASENDVDSWVNLDADLHHVIFLMANNKRAMNIIENLNDQWCRVRIGFSARTDRIGRSIVEHDAIVNAILGGDEEEAARATAEHLSNVREELVSLLINMVLPFVKEGV